MGIIILCFFFMTSGAGINEKISGNMNKVVNNEDRELSVFHFTNLSNKLDDQASSQGLHNNVKYGLFLVIFGILICVGIFKCKNYRKSEKRRLRMNEQMELVEIHNESLAAQGMLNQPMTSKKREDIQKKKDEQEKCRKEQEKKNLRQEKKELKQEKKEGKEGKKQEKDSGKKKKIQKWIQITTEVDSENSGIEEL